MPGVRCCKFGSCMYGSYVWLYIALLRRDKLVMETPPTLDPGASALADVLVKQLSQVQPLANCAGKRFEIMRLRLCVCVCARARAFVLARAALRTRVSVGNNCGYMEGQTPSLPNLRGGGFLSCRRSRKQPPSMGLATPLLTA